MLEILEASPKRHTSLERIELSLSIGEPSLQLPNNLSSKCNPI
jgi:hypothetical protein